MDLHKHSSRLSGKGFKFLVTPFSTILIDQKTEFSQPNTHDCSLPHFSSLYVWSLGRKKPVFVRRRAHGCRPISHHSNGLTSTKIAPIDGTPANGFAQIQRANIASCRQSAAEETGTQQPQQQPNESRTPAATSTAGKGSKRWVGKRRRTLK
jgi:hypothetical protein